MALKTKNTLRKFAHALLLPMVLIMQTGCGLSGLQTAMSNPVAAAPTTSSPALPATNLAGATAPLNTGINAQLAPTANTTSTAANSPQAQTLLQQLNALDQQAQQLMSQGVPETDTRITQIDSQLDTLDQQYQQLTGQPVPQTS